jgi:Flp pilus assembly protein TadG
MRTLPKRLARAEEGVSTIEFAFVATALCTLLLGILDFGLGFWEQMEISNAADAGANYVMANGYTNTDAVNSAVNNATNLSGVTPNSSQVCGCPTSSGIKLSAQTPAPPACGASCSGVTGGSGTSLPYVTVTASVSYSTIFAWPGISSPMTLTAAAIALNPLSN